MIAVRVLKNARGYNDDVALKIGRQLIGLCFSDAELAPQTASVRLDYPVPIVRIAFDGVLKYRP